MANTHEHLEHAEHAEHHAHDPFDKRVAVSMAIIAAILAGIAMLGHRTHNHVLQLLGDSNRYGTEAAATEVEKSNLFAWYQSKKARQTQYEIAAELETRSDDAHQKLITSWRDKAKEYDKPDPKRHESLPELIERGSVAGQKAEDYRKKAKDLAHEAEHVHHQADRLDLAHLLAELGLVLCSVTILTKRKSWWLAGLVSAAFALGAVGSAYLIPHQAQDAHSSETHDPKPAKDAKPPSEKKPDADHH